MFSSKTSYPRTPVPSNRSNRASTIRRTKFVTAGTSALHRFLKSNVPTRCPAASRIRSTSSAPSFRTKKNLYILLLALNRALKSSETYSKMVI